jgi:hypothetical protein
MPLQEQRCRVRRSAVTEWFWAIVAYSCFAAIGGLTVFIMLYWFGVAGAMSRTSSTRANTRGTG